MLYLICSPRVQELLKVKRLFFNADKFYANIFHARKFHADNFFADKFHDDKFHAVKSTADKFYSFIPSYIFFIILDICII